MFPSTNQNNNVHVETKTDLDIFQNRIQSPSLALFFLGTSASRTFKHHQARDRAGTMERVFLSLKNCQSRKKSTRLPAWPEGLHLQAARFGRREVAEISGHSRAFPSSPQGEGSPGPELLGVGPCTEAQGVSLGVIQLRVLEDHHGGAQRARVAVTGDFSGNPFRCQKLCPLLVKIVVQML